ncbi:MAG: PilW family protein [Pseudomonadota bacterium]
MGRQRRTKQMGFSLVELMVSVVLGGMMMAAASALYLASKNSYQEVEEFTSLTENTRFAERLVTDALRHAGFFGEVSANKVTLDGSLGTVSGDCTGAAAAWDVNNYVTATTASSSGAAFGCITDAVPGTDVLVVKRVRPQPLTDGPGDGSSPNGTIDTPSTIDATRPYILTNNVLGLLFDAGGGTPTVTVGGDVPGGSAWEYQFEAYYVRNTDIPSLSRKVLIRSGSAQTITTEDLVQGVERLTLSLGYDSDGDDEVDTFGSVSSVAGNWDRVYSVGVFLLVRGAVPDPQYVDGKTYRIANSTFTPDSSVQSYRRLLTQARVALRNPKLIIRGQAG